MIDNETILTTDKGDVHRFTFDHSFWSFDESSANYASQTDVYKAVGQSLLAKVFEGYNACLLAYGPTGSGKSFRCVIYVVSVKQIILSTHFICHKFLNGYLLVNLFLNT